MIKCVNLGIFDDINTGLETASTTSHPSFQPLRAFEVVGRENVVFQDSYCTQGCFTLQFPNLRSSNPLKLSPAEQLVVDHYEQTLSLRFTTKNPTWSTQQIYICLGAQDPPIIHLLLAISFRGLFFKDKTNNELHELARKIFESALVVC